MKDVVVFEYLISNQERFKQTNRWLIDEKLKLFGIHSPLFHDDIEDEYNRILNNLIVVETSLNTGADYETISIVLEELKLKEFLSV